MARKHCIKRPYLTMHVVQRGTNKCQIYWSDKDRNYFLFWLRKYALKHGVLVHAYALMDNHFHLLLTQVKEHAISKTMRDLGSNYVTHVNRTYERVGTLYQGRFFASVVDTEQYLLNTMRYIENNPLRAGMVRTLFAAKFTSYRANGHGRPDKLISPHPYFVELGENQYEREENYRDWCRQTIPPEELDGIRQATRRRIAIASREYCISLEREIGVSQHYFKPGNSKKPKEKQYIFCDGVHRDAYDFTAPKQLRLEQKLDIVSEEQFRRWRELEEFEKEKRVKKAS